MTSGLRNLDEQHAGVLESLCETIVPGSVRVGPVVYIDAIMSEMPPPLREAVIQSIDALAEAAPGGAEALGPLALTPPFQLIRALAIEAYYSDFLAPGAPGPSAYAEIDFHSPLAMRIKKDWSYLWNRPGAIPPGVPLARNSRGPRMSSERFEVVVVGSGAGGGVVAGELAERGRSVLLLEAGAHWTAADFTRWESRAAHDYWWPLGFAFPTGDPGLGPVVMISGRCVGGSTTINTKVALRATQRELDKWHAATGLCNERGEPISCADLDPYYDRVERYLGVRDRSTDWDLRPCVQTAKRGFEAVGATLEPVRAYVDENCEQCGSCLQGCPTNAGKSTMNTYINRNWLSGALTLRPNSFVERVVIEEQDGGLEATGVQYTDADGNAHTVEADVVVVAAGSLRTPQVLMRSKVPNPNVGRHLGFHPAHFVFGLFDEPQDAHMVAPISGHCYDFAADEDGGFAVEAVTIQDPIGFAAGLSDENGPMWEAPLVEAARKYRRWIGLLNMANDDNRGTVTLDENGNELFLSDFQPNELERITQARAFSTRVLQAAGATQILWSGLATTHMQSSCRMGADPAASVVDTHGQSHEVRRLYVGDSSVHPGTLSVNPSLTIMALATRLADYLHAGAGGQLEAGRERLGGMTGAQAIRPAGGLFEAPRRTDAIADLLANVWQFGYVTTDLDRSIEFMAERFGLEHCLKLPAGGTFLAGDEPMEFDAKFAMGSRGGTIVELIEPVAGEVDFYRRVLPSDGSFAVRLHHIATFIDPGDAEWERLGFLLAASGLKFDYTLVIPDRVRAGYVDTTAELGHWLEVCQLQREDTDFFSSLVADSA